MEPHNPQHAPMVMVAWQAEGNAGKKTIIIDFKSEKGRKVAMDLVKLSDIVLLNKSDQQVVIMLSSCVLIMQSSLDCQVSTFSFVIK